MTRAWIKQEYCIKKNQVVLKKANENTHRLSKVYMQT